LQTVLVANRGEIAVRVMRACRELGIGTVGVYSKADEDALHVGIADQAVCIGPPRAQESYLNVDALIAAAQGTGADAIHPGYGFLAENAAAAARIEEAGLTFIGPPPDVIALMGDKAKARQTALGAGAPVAAGSEPLSDPDAIRTAASKVGFPVVLKPVAGGGGIGMSIVHSEADLEKALAAARQLARAAFGNPELYLEPFLERARHVEIQVAADRRGNVVQLGERECSVQRRYQKLIEETPSPAVDDELRARLAAVSVELARRVGYVTVGTVEFLVAPDGSFFFMEMNTRIQVEHPVTELTTGIDLVREQIRLASGDPLSFRQEDIQPRGHAFEFRITAEDPARNFMPSPGVVERFEAPLAPGVRVDTGIRTGSAVVPFYDPLVCKLVAWDADRASALARARAALEDLVVDGIATTRQFHLWALEQPELQEGTVHTRVLEDVWLPRYAEEPPA
jgi:acetyl-CoA carboxylase, biotin carboxylase subunit